MLGGAGRPGGVGGAGGPSQLPAGGAGGGNWQHNPAHRGGAPYGDRATADRFGGAARGDSLANRQAGARNQIGRQGGESSEQSQRRRRQQPHEHRRRCGSWGAQAEVPTASAPATSPVRPAAIAAPSDQVPGEATTVPRHGPPVAADPPASAAVAVVARGVVAAAGVGREKT